MGVSGKGCLGAKSLRVRFALNLWAELHSNSMNV